MISDNDRHINDMPKSLESIKVREVLEELQKKAINQPIINKPIKCNLCNDSGYIIVTDEEGTNRTKNCICELKKIARGHAIKMGYTDRIDKNTLHNYKPTTKKQIKALTTIKDYIEKYPPNNIIIFGNVGTGKTHLAWSILNGCMDRGVIYRAIPYRELIRLSMSTNFKDDIRNKDLNPLKDIELLLIDDVYKGTIQPSDGEIRHFYELIDYRYNKKLRTIITTEHTPKTLESIDEAIYSRLAETSQDYIVEIDGANYRLRG